MRCCIWILAPLILLFATLFAQQETIRVEVEAVNVLVSVTDKKGRFVTDLERHRFQITEDGVPQEITNFSRETALPLQIGLLIDTSASVRTKLSFEKAAATNFIYSVLRPQDEVLLVEFDTGVSLISDFTSQPSEIAGKLKNLRAGGGTALLDAVYAVSRDKMHSIGVRKALVVVSDGADLNSKRNLEEAVEMAQTVGVTIYGIGTTRFGASGDKKGEEMLQDLTEASGGQAFFPYSEAQFQHAFDTINDELRSRYSITYVPTNRKADGTFRKIKVRISKGKNFEMRYRKGYYASPTVSG